MVSGLMAAASLGLGEGSRLVRTGTSEEVAGDSRPAAGPALEEAVACGTAAVPAPIPPSTGMPFSERNSSKSTYCIHERNKNYYKQQIPIYPIKNKTTKISKFSQRIEFIIRTWSIY